jgi:dihydrolipoamide dehydrogenase
VIGLEFATVYTRLGAKVLVVERCRTSSPAPISRSRRRSAHPQEARRRDRARHQGRDDREGRRAGVSATFNGEYTSGKPETREFDMVLVAVGRRPVTDTLNLAAAGLATDDKGFIDVDAQRARGRRHLRDRRHHRRPLLAHKAMKEGVVAAEVIAGDRASAFDPVAMPNCVYTDPEVATVGLSEEEAKAPATRCDRQVPADRLGPRAHDERDRRPDQTRRRCEDRSAARHAHRRAASGIADRRRRDRARDGRDVEDIGLSIHPHPTLTESIMDAAEAMHGKAIHIPNPKPAVGIAVKRMTSLHGLALNVSTELDYDRLVNPCGMPAFGITSMERELGRPVTLAAASQALLSALARRFDAHVGQSEARPEPASWGTG